MLNLSLLFIASLLLFAGCSTPPGPDVEMPPPLPEPPEILSPMPVLPAEKAPLAPKEPDDFKLKVNNYFTSFAELESGKIDKTLTVTLITDPASVAYARTEKLMVRISELGYRVNYEPAK
jgi:hypothetical protein